MRSLLIVVIVAILMAWASTSWSALCNGVPPKYGIDCSPAVVFVQPEVIQGGSCSLPAQLPCEL